MRAAHELSHPPAQHQPARQPYAADQQALQRVHAGDLPARDPPAAQDGDLALPAPHHHAGNQADEIKDETDHGQAKNGQGERQHAG